MPRIVDHAQQRRALSATAAALIASAGLEQTSLRSVASHHGCTKGMVQHYFSDKEQLLLAAMDFIEQRFHSATEQAAAGRQGLDSAHAGLRAQLPMNTDLCRDWQVRLVFRTRGEQGGRFGERLQRYRTQQEEALMRGLRQARRGSELRTGLPLRNSARSLQAMVWGMGLDEVANPGLTPPSAQRQMLKTAIDNLRP